MVETPADFPIFPFVQELFEDLSITLPSLGCHFEGYATPNDLSSRGKRVTLKNKLFLLFADMAQGHQEMQVKFALSAGQDDTNKEWCFVFQHPVTPDISYEALSSWSPDFHRVHQAEGDGFSLYIPEGKPLDIGPPLNWRELFQLYGSPQSGHNMAQAFFKRCDDLIIQLGIAIQANNCDECFRIAHTIKGASRGIFAIPFSTKALKLEMAGRSQVLTDAPTLYKDLRTSYDELIIWYQKGEV